MLLELSWCGGQPHLGKVDLEKKVSTPVRKKANELWSQMKTSSTQSSVSICPYQNYHEPVLKFLFYFHLSSS